MKFNKDMKAIKFNTVYLVEWLYDGQEGEYMHSLAYLDWAEDGVHRWMWDSGEYLDEKVVGWFDFAEELYKEDAAVEDTIPVQSCCQHYIPIK